VRLIATKTHTITGGAKRDQWSSPLVTLARRAGDVEEHALLLCGLLLGFGLDAYIALGTAKQHGHYAFVVTRRDAFNITAWDACTGQRWTIDTLAFARLQRQTAGSPVDAASPGGGTACSIATSALPADFPFVDLYALFNDRQFFANCQLDDHIASLSFALENAALWKPLSEAAIAVLPRRPAIVLRPSTIVAAEAERALESKLQALLSEYRAEVGFPTTNWDSALSHVLAAALSSYESERVYGVCHGQEEFADAIKHSIPVEHAFAAVPFQFTTTQPALILEAMLASTSLLHMLHEGPPRSQVALSAASVTGLPGSGTAPARFAMRVKVCVYPEDVLAVWLIVAQVKRNTPFDAIPIAPS
jgi:centrosomal protein CEP76